MVRLVLLTLINSLLGGAAQILGPFAASVWTAVGNLIMSPLMRGAKARLPAGTDRANVSAVRTAAFYVKMSVSNPAGLLSVLCQVVVAKATPPGGLGPGLDRAVAVIACVATALAVGVAGPLCIFPALTGVWLWVNDRYEWGGGVSKWAVVIAVPVLKVAAAAATSELMRSSHYSRLGEPQEWIPAYVEAFPLCFTAECLLVAVAVTRGMRATPQERAKVYMDRLSMLPLALLAWTW